MQDCCVQLNEVYIPKCVHVTVLCFEQDVATVQLFFFLNISKVCVCMCVKANLQAFLSTTEAIVW